MRLRRAVAIMTVGGLTAALLQVPLVTGLAGPLGAHLGADPAAASDAPAGASAAPDPTTAALAQAAASGEPVEVTAQRSEYSQVFAQPDGLLMAQTSATPVFGHDASGALAPIDTTLTTASDGSIRPVASAADVAFPSRGTDDVVSLSYQGRTLKMTMPGTLATPAVAGSTATYADVFPGVDLQLTATAEGFQELLVIKSAAAAADPQLNQLAFPATTQDATLRREPGGGIAVLDPWGATVFASAPALMWDSSGDATLEGPSGTGAAGPAGMAALQQEAELASPVPTDPAPDSSDGTDPVTGTAEDPGAAAGTDTGTGTGVVASPGPGDAWAAMPLSVKGDAVSVTPSQAMLDDPDTTFPVYLDPDPGLARTTRMRLRSDNQNIWQFNGEQGMGKCPIDYDSSCTAAYTDRLYFTFPRVNLFNGSKVVNAVFSDEETWSANCTNHNVKLVQTGAISSSSKWGGPKNIKTISTVSTAHGYSSACPDGLVKFSNSTLISLAQQMADSSISSLTLSLQAGDETDQLAWKRFDDGAQLQVWYHALPKTPTWVGYQLAGHPAGTSSCNTWVGNAAVVDTVSPIFYATIHDMDANVEDPNLAAQFEVQQADVTTSTHNWVDSWNGGGLRLSPTDFTGVNGEREQYQPVAMSQAPELEFRVRARTEDHWELAGQSGTDASAFSDWCYFFVDTDSPVKPTVTLTVTGDDGNPKTVDAATLLNGTYAWSAVGASGQFTVADGQSPDLDFSRFQVTVNAPTGPQTVAVIDGSWTFTPDQYGLYDLVFATWDTANRPSKPAEVKIAVPPPAGNVADWAVVSSDTTSVADAATTGALTLSGSASITAAGTGRRGMLADPANNNDPFDSAIAFGSTGGQALAATRVFDPGQPFTVMAWVKLADTATDHTALAQTSTDNAAGIEVGYRTAANSGAGGWTATLTSDTGGTVTVTSPAPATAGVWTHLALTRSQNGSVDLAVDGRPGPGSTAPTMPVDDTTRLVIGHGGKPTLAAATSPFTGQVDEIRVWTVGLEPDEAYHQAMLSPDTGNPLLSRVADWQVDATDTTGMKDQSPNQTADLALSGGATISTSGPGAVTLDGNSGSLEVTGPLLDETSPFTASVTLTPDTDAMAAASQTMFRVIGQAGTVAGGGHDSWALWFEKTSVTDGVPDGHWVLGRWSAPGSTQPSAQVTYESTSSGFDLTDEVTLNATYQPTDPGDPTPGEMEVCLSAGTVQIGCMPYTDPAQGSGPLTVGKAPTGTTPAWGDWLPADISRVALYAGSATADQLEAIDDPSDTTAD